MKQLLQNMKTGETSVADVPIPTPQAGEVLIQTAASLVSAGTERSVVEFAEKSLLGKARSRPDLVRQVLDKVRREGLLTTLDAVFNRLDQPLPLGYSSAGVIAALGPGVQGFRVGQRVACAGGNYAVHAEYGCVPLNLIAALPDSVDFAAAAFTTLGAIALHGFRLAEPQIGERVAVIGLGLLGLLEVMIAHAAGCAVVGVDPDPERVALARKLGAVAVTRPEAEEAAQSFSRGRGCDAVLICAGASSNDPVELAGAIARDRAKVVAVGAVGQGLPRKVYFEKELSFINSRSYGPGRYDPFYEEGGRDYPLGYVRWTEGRNLEAVVDLLAAGKMPVEKLITHRIAIEDAAQAYEIITGKRKEPFLGVLLTYPTSIVEASCVEISTNPAALDTRTFQRFDTVALGVLGAGLFANATLLPALRKVDPLQRLGIASASGVAASHAARKFGFQYAASDEKQILDDPKINTVAILTRHHLHAGQVIRALQAGKHVFCEKPLAITREQLSAIREQLLVTGQCVLMTGFNRRFAPLARQMKAFLDGRSEPLAAHYRVNAGYLPLNHWLHDPEQGGGRLIGEACHFVDFLTFLVGAPPLSVTARSLPDAGRYREDNAVLTFTFPDGSLGSVSYLANGDKGFPKERVEAFAGGRVAVLDDFRTLELARDGKRQVTQARWAQDKGHRGEWEAFAAAIRAGGPPPIPYDQMFGVHDAVFAALDALRSG